MAGKIEAICISEKKGTEKKPIQETKIIENFGLEHDAHAGKWHRQVSLLPYEEREDFKRRGGDVEDGAFGENLLISGIDFNELVVGSHVHIGEVDLEITQRGKSCHAHCRIYHQVGECIMPRLGIFARVIHGGVIHCDDEVTYTPPADSRMRVAILTLSDKGSQGLRVDESGPSIKEYMEERGYHVTSLDILPDNQKMIEQAVKIYPNFKVVATTLREVKTATRNDWKALCWMDGTIYHSREYKDLEIMDRVGGGDSFASGLLYGLMTYQDAQLAVDYGAAHGALAMTTPGDTSMAGRREVEAVMQGAGARVQR